MNCFWCDRGLDRLKDDVIIAKFNQARLTGEQTVFESAIDDLTHSLYHKTRYKSLDDADAMDVVLDAIERWWVWLTRQRDQ